MNVLKVFQYIFAFVGALVLVIAGSLFINTRSFLTDAVRVEGTVTGMSVSRSRSQDQDRDTTYYHPVVRFAGPDGAVEFTSSVGRGAPAYNTGDTVPVLYNPKAPENARIESFSELWMAPLITGLIGGVLFGIGALFFGINLASKRRKTQLLSSGTPIQAEIQGVEVNHSLVVNGKSPFRVMAEWLNPATSEIHLFHSENLWHDPTRYITQKQVTVFIDSKNPKRYYMDISFLPKVAA